MDWSRGSGDGGLVLLDVLLGLVFLRLAGLRVFVADESPDLRFGGILGRESDWY
jgi:hypothetical protein